MSTESDDPVPEPDDERVVTAFHEAGHAVAAVMRGGSTLTSVTLDEHTHGVGITWVRHHSWDSAFAIWAGPWAEARHAWKQRDADDDFDDFVTGVFLYQSEDRADYERAVEAEEVMLSAGTDWRALRAVKEEVWHGELERVWPAIQRVAALLLAGESVTDADVRDIHDRCYDQE